MKLLFVSLEFAADTVFSGNGTYGRSLAFALAALGHDVHVVCATPAADGAPPTTVDTGVAVTQLPVPAAKWRRLDWHSAHTEFAAAFRSWAASGTASRSRPAAGGAAAYDAVLAVDWTGWAAAGGAESVGLWPAGRSVFLNFRVFTVACPQEDAEERAFYHRREAEAVLGAGRSVALSTADARALEEIAREHLHHQGAAHRRGLQVHVVFPPLRHAVLSLAQGRLAAPADHTKQKKRRYVTCCVRLDRPKNALRFVECVELLAARGLWPAAATPFLCGAAADAEYAAEVRQRLAAAGDAAGAPPVIATAFLAPAELCGVFEEALLNVHPCLYDAYGLTVAEAAAMGASTLLHAPALVGSQVPPPPMASPSPDRTPAASPLPVGVAELLPVGTAVFSTDFTALEEAALTMRALVLAALGAPDGTPQAVPPAQVRAVAAEAQRLAMSYTEAHCGEAVAAFATW